MTTTLLPIQRLNNVLINVVNHRETNLIVTALLLFLALSISLKSLLIRFELIRQPQEASFTNDDNFNADQFVNRSSDNDYFLLHSDQISSSSDHTHHRPMSFLASDHALQSSSAPFSPIDHVQTLSPFTDLDVQPLQSANHVGQQLIPADQHSPHQIPLSTDQDQQQQQRPASVSPGAVVDQQRQDDDHYRHSPSSFVTSSLISLFFLVSLSLCVGRLLSYFFIPSITGPILIGILFTNFTPFRSLLHYAPHYQLFALIYEIAFLMIIVRTAFGIDQLALRQYFALCASLGFFCPLFECAITVLASHFFFHLQIATSILFGFALCASSLAVISPIILCLKKEQRGINLGLHSVVLTSTSIDNIVALTGFAITFGILSPHSDVLIYTLTRLPAELLVGSIIGILVGLILRCFPRADLSFAHFIRFLLICSFAVAAHFGAQTIGCALFGPTMALFAIGVAKMRWQIDNNRNTRLEENALCLGWDLMVGQLLFLHLGMLVNLSSFDVPTLGPAFAVLALSLVSRLISSLLCAFLCFNTIASTSQLASSRDRHKERLFLAIATLPKASLQCHLLLPMIVQLLPTGLHNSLVYRLPVTVCLLAVLTVPIWHFLLQFLGKTLLRPTTLTMLGTVTTAQLSKADDHWGKVTKSDPKDNRLKLEVGRDDGAWANCQMQQRKQQLRL